MTEQVNGNSEFETNEIVIFEGGDRFVGAPIERELVVNFADTLMGVHPSAKEIGKLGMRTIAQIALITGAHPLPGTNGIHAWRDKKNNLCIQLGIGFWRGQVEIAGGMIWKQRPHNPNLAEDKNGGVISSYCEGALRSDVLGLLREMRSMGIDMTFAEAKEEVFQTGAGIVNPNEYTKAGRDAQWTADLRAERDLLRKLVPVLQRPRKQVESVVNGGGSDWSLNEFVTPPAREQLPADYDIAAANDDLFE